MTTCIICRFETELDDVAVARGATAGAREGRREAQSTVTLRVGTFPSMGGVTISGRPQVPGRGRAATGLPAAHA